MTDGTGNLVWTNSALVPVPGVNTQVIFNNSGVYGSNSNFTYDIGLNTLTVPNISATLTAGPQTGINAVGTLTSLIVSGSIAGANISGGNTVTANYSVIISDPFIDVPSHSTATNCAGYFIKV
jgi:hypothetical protein